VVPTRGLGGPSMSVPPRTNKMHELCGLETAAVQPQRTFEHNGVQHSLVAVFKKLDTVIVEFVETFTVEI
jgi:hypothetical protein